MWVLDRRFNEWEEPFGVSIEGECRLKRLIQGKEWEIALITWRCICGDVRIQEAISGYIRDKERQRWQDRETKRGVWVTE